MHDFNSSIEDDWEDETPAALRAKLRSVTEQLRSVTEQLRSMKQACTNILDSEVNPRYIPMELSDIYFKTIVVLANACSWQIFMAAHLGRWLGVVEMYEKREEWKAGKLQLTASHVGRFKAEWVEHQSLSQRPKRRPEMLLEVTPLSPGVTPPEFLHERVEDMEELCGVVKFINDTLRGTWVPIFPISRKSKHTAYEISESMQFLIQEILTLDPKGNFEEKGVNLKQQAALFRIVFGYPYTGISNVGKEEQMVEIWDRDPEEMIHWHSHYRSVREEFNLIN